MTLEFQSIAEIGHLLGDPFNGHVDDILVLNSNDENVRIYVRHGANLVAFKMSSNPSSNNWNKLWNRQIFKDAQRSSYPTQAYPWCITDTMLDDGSDGVVVRNEDGIVFYSTSKSVATLQVLSRDTSFRDIYGWGDVERSVILIGRFYRNIRLVGVMSLKRMNKSGPVVVQFYAADTDRLVTHQPHPLFPLRKSTVSTDISWIADATHFYVANIQGNGQDNIIVRKKTQLEIYRFDYNYELQQVGKVSLVDSAAGLNERFFFVNLTGQPDRDIVHFTRFGLFVYQPNTFKTNETAIKDYALINYHSAFSETVGWIAEYSQSIHLVDTDGDGHDDLLFTGPKGLMVLGFDAVGFFWKTLLDPSSFIQTNPQRLATLVGATKAVVRNRKRESFLLTLDEEKRLHLGRLIVKSKPKLPDIPRTVQTVAPTVKPIRHSNVKIPLQMKRMIPASKILRWTEQYAEPITFADVVDPVTGSLHFSLPIIAPSSSYDPAIPHSISLSYESQRNTVSNIVGLGWTLLLPDNYVSVDYQNSIFVEDWAFYLTMNGIIFQLKPISAPGQVLFFREPTLKCEIEFYRKEQRWIVQTETDTLTYGCQGMMEAVRWNLHWPHWRGEGNDVKSLKRIPLAWYLIQRRVKATGRLITYHYNIDTIEEKNCIPPSSWTAAIRLKKIESSTTVTFDYAVKQKQEYQSFNHIQVNQSSLLLFPVPLKQSHYLTGCHITTEHYSQTLKFVYQTDEKGRRLLTAIEQPVNANVIESIFRFDYHEEDSLGNGVILTDIKLSNGLKIHFQYDKIEAVNLPDPHSSVAHPVDEQPAIAYSQQYAVMAFRQRELPDNIQLKILGVNSHETLLELSPIPAKTKGTSYGVLAYADFFIVLLQMDEKQQICLYHHSIQDGTSKWEKDPTCHWFNDNALLRSSKDGVVLIDNGSDIIRIFELNADLSKWMEHRLKLPFNQIIQLEMVDHLVVGYDDHHLFICHRQTLTGQWQIQNIEKLDGLFNGGSSIVKKFRLPSEIEKTLIETLKDDVLQVTSNSIAVSSLHLNDDQQLFLKLRLFLLDADLNVVRQRVFTVHGEHILELKHRIDAEGTTYQLAYHLTNDSVFRLRIMNVSGDLVNETHSKIEQDANRHFDTLETEWKKNATILQDTDFKNYYNAKQEQFFAWKRMASNPTNNKKTDNTKVQTTDQPTCDDVSYAPCHQNCHKMEALSRNKTATLTEAVRIKKEWDDCYAEDWKKQWVKNLAMMGEQLIYEPMGKLRNKMVELKSEWINNGVDITSVHRESQDLLTRLNADKAFQTLFDQSFLVNWSIYRVVLTPHGLLTSNGTLIQMTGDDWHLQDPAAKLTSNDNTPFFIRLGKSFILKETAVDGRLQTRNWTLYDQDSVSPYQEVGPPLHQLQISPPDRIINNYPVYLVYQTPANNTVVVFFSNNGETLGNVHTFTNEQLMMGSSSYEQVATLASKDQSHPERMEFLTRSLRSINEDSPSVKNSGVKRVKTSNSDASLRRYTGYRWNNNIKENVMVAIVPGNDRKLAGWIRQTWTYNGDQYSGRWNRTSLEMFGADGNSVQNTHETEENTDDPVKSDSILWDLNNQRIISDFSPYSLRDQMVSYYGFERYEVNNSSIHWRFVDSDVVVGGFPFTGNNHLRLKANNQTSVLEGTFQPIHQDINYVASCWIRSSDGVNSLASTTEIDLVTNHFKAIISVEETEVVGLLGRIIRKAGDWSYAQVLIDFDIIMRLYNEEHGTIVPQFTITLKVNPEQTADLDVDHIRFAPIAHEFKATVYDVEHGHPINIIGNSGSISRTVYYHGREMAMISDVTTDGLQKIEKVTTCTSTGLLLPTPKGSSSLISKQPPCRIVFYPENGGLYETFDTYAWRNRWTHPQSDSSAQSPAWSIAPGRLYHNHEKTHLLVSTDPSTLFGTDNPTSSTAIRYYYSLISSVASVTWKLPLGQIRLAPKSEQLQSILTFTESHNGKSSILTNLPNNGELILMTEGKRFFIWVDSVLLMDVALPAKRPWSSMTFEAQGNIFIEDCVFMGNPRMEMEYRNEWGEKMQTIQLESDTSVLVSQTLYDKLGRPAITTKLTRIISNDRKPLVTFYSDFIRGSIDPSNPLSVWHTHRLRGEVDRLNVLDRGVAYFRVEYEANPLNEKVIEGLPGPEFTVNGQFVKKSRTLNSLIDKIAIVSNHFPSNRGFRYKVEELAEGTIKVAVLDANDNRVALYIYVPGYNHLLSTYEYDSKKRLIKILPPLYHVHADTMAKFGPLLQMIQPLSADEIRWQETYATFMQYDEETDQLVSKTTPDAGTFNYYYNRAGQVRLDVHSSTNETDEIDSVVFYEYDDRSQTVIRTGYLEHMPMSRDVFQKSLAEGTLTNAKDYQSIDRTEAEQRHYDPSLWRGERTATFVTKNANYNIVEQMRWDGQDRLVECKRIVPASHRDFQIRKTYYSYSNRLRSIEYPSIHELIEPIRLEHRYNKLGQLIELILDGQQDAAVRFTYHANGQLASEYLQPGSRHGFNRTFHYNSPGYLEQITDLYLTESISYTDGGYGQSGYGDGIIMKTTFNAKWSPNADWRWFQVEDLLKFMPHTAAQLCLNALKRNGYMSKTGRPLKDYNYPFSGDGQDKNWMPLICGGQNGQRLAKLLAQKRMPRIYGHRYAYGHHQELVKAKYFTDESEMIAIPFQPDSLASQTALGKGQSRDIWKQLEMGKFIVTDNRNLESSAAIANPGASLLRSGELEFNIKEMTLYQDLIEKMILNDIGQGRKKMVELKEFQQIFLQWKGITDGLPLANINLLKLEIENVHRKLVSTMNDNSDWLNPKLMDIFRPAEYSPFLSKFVSILCQRFSYGLGEHPFDVASYEIDANGNHRKFYTGFNRYKFSYEEKRPNQIRSVKGDVPGEIQDGKDEMNMLHDTHGNVIQALHKAIQRIEYNTASKRTTAIHLTDGRTVRFAYDGHGERTLKQVLAKDGNLMLETHYVRDEDGRVLFDRRTTFSQIITSLPNLADSASVVVTTAYIYGPRGLVGFIRNGTFHSVWTDHSGSIRLVLRDGQVIFGYDYLPYGQLMRSYGNDPAAEIAYRYTGQEWDEETGLYNFHARLYDPDIGRFYQPDPRAQYFSPYKYVGNSPVSLVDPDGEFAYLLPVLFMLGGAYLRGAAANNNWNPGQWNYKTSETWKGIVFGGLLGFVAPAGAAATIAAIGVPATLIVVLGAGYVSAAASSGTWDSTKWDFSKPSIYNAFFEGATTVFGINAASGATHKFINQFGRIGKLFAKTGTHTVGIGMAYNNARLASEGEFNPLKWNFTNPNTVNELLEGLTIPLITGARKLRQIKPEKIAASFPKKFRSTLARFANVLTKAAKSDLGRATAEALTIAHKMGLFNEMFDAIRLDDSSFDTYEEFLNDLTLGIDARNMLTSGKTRFDRHFNGKSFQRNKLAVAKTQLTINKAFDNIRTANIHNRIKTRLVKPKQSPRLSLANDGPHSQFSAKHSTATNISTLIDAQSLSNLFAEIQAPTNQIRRKMNQVFTDRKIGSMGCGTRSIQSHNQGTVASTPCRIDLPDRNRQMKLKYDPVGFLKETPISAKTTDDLNYFIERGLQLANGGKYLFQLTHALDAPGYHLKIASPFSKDVTAIQGYWLNAKEKIHINPLGETRFIFTGELHDCSIYIKYKYDYNVEKGRRNEPQMTVYHHQRQFQQVIYFKDGRFVTEERQRIRELDGVQRLFDVNGNVLHLPGGEITPVENIYRKEGSGKLKMVMENMVKRNRILKKIEDDLADEYDIAIHYEDYMAVVSNYQTVMIGRGLSNTFSTAILYRDQIDNQWYFASQNIGYPDSTNNENFCIYPEQHVQSLADFLHHTKEKKTDGSLYQLKNNEKTLGVYVKPLNSIPRSQSEADSFTLKIFPTRKHFKEYIKSLTEDIDSISKPIPSEWQDRIENKVDVRDLNITGKGRFRRSTLTETINITYKFKHQQDQNDTQPSVDPEHHHVTSSGARPESWIELLSSSIGRQIFKSIVSITSLESIFEFLTVPPIPNQSKKEHQRTVGWPSQFDTIKHDYRDVTMSNCYTFPTEAAVVCYNHGAKTLLFAQSQSSDNPPLPLEQAQDTFRQCRPIEWYSKPSVTCQGEKTTFIHTPYEVNSAAVKLFNAIDGWLLLIYTVPGFYRQVGKLVSHVKKVWAGSAKINVPISNEWKESWQKQMQQVDKLIAKCETHHVKWALPLVEEIRQQIGSLTNKSNVETMDDMRAVKTMTERLSALIEDVGQLADFETDDEDQIFYDCLEECPVKDDNWSNESNNSSQSISATLHHLTGHFKNLKL